MLGLCWVVDFIFHFDRLCRGGIPVRRFIVHGAVKEAEREKLATLRELKWLRRKLSDC